MPRRWQVWYGAAMVGLGCALSALAWTIVQQDRALAAQRLSEMREAVADRVVSVLERRMVELERGMSGEPCPGQGVCVSLRDGRLKVWPAGRVLYRPDAAAMPELAAPVLSEADEAEFVARDSRKALEVLRRAGARAPREPRMRAALLAREARNERKLGRGREALRLYGELAELGEAQVGGMPAALAGRLGMMSVERERAAGLRDELLAGRWAIPYGTFAALRQQVEEVLGRTAFRTVLAEAVGRILEEGLEGESGRARIEVESGPAVVVWRGSGQEVSAYVADGESEWLEAAAAIAEQSGVKVSLGETKERAAVRLASSTGLPWTVQVTNGAGGDSGWRRRAWMAGVGLALVLAMVMTAGWVLGRAVERQLALAREQSDFVSAVSHEFRTPLTALKQLTELLMQGRVASDRDREEYYRLLHAESGRLERVVEGLLTFGRLEAGQGQFRFEAVEARELVQRCVEEFAGQASGFRLEVSGAGGTMRADREALKVALWNLLENASKYSQGREQAWVCVEQAEGEVRIRVRDEGMGIPKEELGRVFEKFVRGVEAKRLGVRGTGVGLATVKQIADAHGGRIEVESEPGRGSTFTLRLPEWKG